MTTENTGHLLSVYCPNCGKVTDKISFNLLREAGKVCALCPQCQRRTYIEYNGEQATLYHQDDAFEEVIENMTPAERKDFKAFVKGEKE
jgi:NAD-dependent SIR2 family protein deacetylase